MQYLQYLHNKAGYVYMRRYQLPPPHYDYTAMRHTPQSVREHYREMGLEDGTQIVARELAHECYERECRECYERERREVMCGNIHGHIVSTPGTACAARTGTAGQKHTHVSRARSLFFIETPPCTVDKVTKPSFLYNIINKCKSQGR